MLDFLVAFFAGCLSGGSICYGLCWIAHEPAREKAAAWDVYQRTKARAGAIYGRVSRGYDETNEPSGSPV